MKRELGKTRLRERERGNDSIQSKHNVMERKNSCLGWNPGVSSMRKNLGMRLFGMNVVFCTISNECCARFGNESGEAWE